MSGVSRVVGRGRVIVEPSVRLIRPGLAGFRKFLMRGNIVDLAVAVIIGTAFTAVVKAMVDDLLTPLVAAVGGKPDFAGLTFALNHSVFHYGLFLNSLVTFMFVAGTVYFTVVLPLAKANNLRRRARSQPAEQEAAQELVLSDETRLLTEIRDLLAAGETRPDPTETDPTETDPTEADPTEADPTEADPTEIGPTEIGAGRAESVGTEPDRAGSAGSRLEGAGRPVR